MAISVNFDHTNKLVIARCDEETLTIEHLHDYLSVWNTDNFDYHALFIMTAADLSQLEFTKLLEQATASVQLDARGSLLSRNAIVVNGEMGESLARFFQNAKGLISESRRVSKVFTDEAEAIAWLTQQS